jgi:hypothetical protein
VVGIKIRKKTWIGGSCLRMEDGKIKKKIVYGKFYNTRPVGKPRRRWEDVVRRDTSHILGIWGWRKPAKTE